MEDMEALQKCGAFLLVILGLGLQITICLRTNVDRLKKNETLQEIVKDNYLSGFILR